jgi:signal transduction histidine kinase
VANASHELRTPLTVARALLEVALADPAVTTAALRSACEEVLEVGQEQERLIEALLTLARSQRGLDQRAPFDLARVARRVLDQRDGRAREGGLGISADLAPASAAGDRALAERLVANLADNALSYNRPGGRVVVTTGIRDGCAVLRVINTGPLVPADQVERLLQPFQRLGPDRTTADNSKKQRPAADNSKKREATSDNSKKRATAFDQPGGSGLGLSIVAAIARAHGASVSARPGLRGGLSVEVVFAPVTASGSVLTPGGVPALVR